MRIDDIILVSVKSSLWKFYMVGMAFGTGPCQSAEPFAIKPFFERYCIDCHGEKKQKGQLSLHEIPLDFKDGESLEHWRMIEEQIRFLDMPPEDERQPGKNERQQALKWIKDQLLGTQTASAVGDRRLLLPKFGNHVDHDALFNSPPGPVIPAPPRLWRLRPELYESSVREISDGDPKLSQPFSTHGGSGIQDYANLYFVDEPATDLLLRNAERIVQTQARKGRFGPIHKALGSRELPGESLMADAIKREFQLALRRDPTPLEASRFIALWKKNIASSGHPIGSQSTLMAVLMLPEALFRSELGEGPLDELGRLRLSQTEIARAINFALRDRIDDKIFEAAGKGELATREQITAQINRLFDDPRNDNPRILEFFREYFGYRNALNVFKDHPDRGIHDANLLVSDLEYLIRDIVREDREVLKTLLTSDKAYINWKVDRKRGTTSPAIHKIGYATTFGFPPDWQWTPDQPVTLPPGERSGVLTHPAWLVAFSGNFDNDPVHRGKWVLDHLLGGSVPDVPIGVDARIPENEDLTLRERLHTATREPNCWRCHKKMDPLGLPFEQFTHYGHFRNREKMKPVDTTGFIDRTGDSSLDKTKIKDPVSFLHLLADSERTGQVFVRHAFRFYLGRNETLGDAATLQNAWQAYRNNDGSFRALVTSLLTSDSFLLRKP